MSLPSRSASVSKTVTSSQNSESTRNVASEPPRWVAPVVLRSRTWHTVADHLLDRLEEWGVHTIFGYSGDGINGILGALDRAGDRFEFIQPRHERRLRDPGGSLAVGPAGMAVDHDTLTTDWSK